MHVLSLFLAANGAHVPDLEATMTADETAMHVANVGAAIADIADGTAEERAGTGTVATAMWPGDIAADPDATPAVEAVPGVFSLSVNPRGNGAIPFELRESKDAVDLNNDGDTDDEGESARIINTARKIDDLGVFRGYDLWEDDGTDATGTAFHTDDGARVIVFTNKTQDDPPVEASAEVTARSVENVAVTTDTLTKLGTKSGNTYTGAEYTPTGEAALMGTLTCPSGTTCSVDATTAADGTVTINAVSGYVFTGSREAKAAVEVCDAACQATANNDYLVFGLWIDEANDGTGDAFGAFAVGGTGYAVNVQNAVTGTATYSGVAAGAHHKTGEGVNWFDGDARLTANFGTPGTDTDPTVADDEPGTISGSISNIRVNGGPVMSDSIELRQAALTDALPPSTAWRAWVLAKSRMMTPWITRSTAPGAVRSTGRRTTIRTRLTWTNRSPRLWRRPAPSASPCPRVRATTWSSRASSEPSAPTRTKSPGLSVTWRAATRPPSFLCVLQ